MSRLSLNDLKARRAAVAGELKAVEEEISMLAGLRMVDACRVCGCTEDNACEDGCWWVEPDLCSSCVTPGRRAKGAAAG